MTALAAGSACKMNISGAGVLCVEVEVAGIAATTTVIPRGLSHNIRVVGKWIMSGHYVMMAFLLAYRLNERGFDTANVGWFSALNGLGLFIGGFTITKIADVHGPKYMLITSQLIAIIYTLIAWLAPTSSIIIISVAFVITGLTQISDNVGYSNMCLFLCPTEDKSTYVAATNIGIIPFMVILPIIIGKLMDVGIISYNGTFTIAVIMMVASIIYIFAMIDNPKAYIDMKADVVKPE